MATSRRPLALGIVTVAVVCGIAAIAANFGILSQTHDTPLGRLVPPVSVAVRPAGALTPNAVTPNSATPTIDPQVGTSTPTRGTNDTSGRKHDS